MDLSLLQLQSVRTALESKASNDQMSELKGVLSEVDKLVSNRLTCPGGGRMAAILLAKPLTSSLALGIASLRLIHLQVTYATECQQRLQLFRIVSIGALSFAIVERNCVIFSLFKPQS